MNEAEFRREHELAAAWAKAEDEVKALKLQVGTLQDKVDRYEELDEACKQMSMEFAREFFRNGEGHVWEAPFTLSKLLEMIRDEFHKKDRLYYEIADAIRNLLKARHNSFNDAMWREKVKSLLMPEVKRLCETCKTPKKDYGGDVGSVCPKCNGMCG